MSNKFSTTHILISLFIAVIVIGLGLLISRQVFNYSGLAFDVLTYVLSVVALILAVLSVINTLRQGRKINQMVRDVHSAVGELKQVTASNDKIEKEISEEYRMNKVITEVLSEYGFGESKRVRRSIAKKVSRRLNKDVK